MAKPAFDPNQAPDGGFGRPQGERYPFRKWIGVSSSNLYQVMFVPYNDRIAGDANKLYIRFRSGSMYVYYNVRRDVWEALLSARSKGRFHHRRIKWSYRFARLE